MYVAVLAGTMKRMISAWYVWAGAHIDTMNYNMKIRHKELGTICSSSGFNTHSISEIHVLYPDDGGADSDFMRNYDVWLDTKQCWMDLLEAFKMHDVIVDNYNTHFFEPTTPDDRYRGYTLY